MDCDHENPIPGAQDLFGYSSDEADVIDSALGLTRTQIRNNAQS